MSVMDKVMNLFRGAKDQSQRVASKGADMASSAADRAQDMASQAKDMASDAKEMASNAQDMAGDALDEVKEHVAGGDDEAPATPS